MTRCGNYILLFNDESADRAVLAFGEAACGTGCRNRLVGDCRVSLCGDGGLCHDDLATVRALAAVGEPIGGAGGGVTLDRHAGMVDAELAAAKVTNEVSISVIVAQSGNGALGAADLKGAAFLAVNDLVVAAVGIAAGVSDIFADNSCAVVGVLGDSSCFNRAAICAAPSLFALCGAGWGDVDLPVTEAVTLWGEGRLCCQYAVADRAVLALGETAFRAVGGFGGIRDSGMSRGGNLGLFFRDGTAYRAMLTRC